MAVIENGKKIVYGLERMGEEKFHNNILKNL
jgi:hypothetical protein